MVQSASLHCCYLTVLSFLLSNLYPPTTQKSQYLYINFLYLLGSHKVIATHDNAISSCTFFDDTTLITSSHDKTLKLWVSVKLNEHQKAN